MPSELYSDAPGSILLPDALNPGVPPPPHITPLCRSGPSGGLHFSLPEGAGLPVPKAPWLVGGGWDGALRLLAPIIRPETATRRAQSHQHLVVCAHCNP